MQVTSNSLFHFTNSLQNLKGILKDKFQLTYCREQYKLDYETHDSYYPIISFCDIPLSLTKKHINSYGSYGIGMKKEWGINHGLNPVLYIENNSQLAEGIQNTTKNIDTIETEISLQLETFKKNFLSHNENFLYYITKLKEEHKMTPSNNQNLSNVLKMIEDLAQHTFDEAVALKHIQTVTKRFAEMVHSHNSLYHYIKNYQGKLSRTGEKPILNYRFYDEREWRFVPALTDKRVSFNFSEEDYKKYRGDGKSKPFIEGINLEFKAEDIKYLIVKSNRDIPPLIKTIKSIDNLAKNSNEADVLTTKILTVEQIENDF